MQKQLPDSHPNPGTTGIVNGQDRAIQFLESADQAPELRRFPTRFAPFKCDKETGHPLPINRRHEKYKCQCQCQCQSKICNVLCLTHLILC